MRSAAALTAGHAWRPAAVSGAVVAAALHLRYAVDPRLVYHAQQPAYYSDTSWWAAVVAAPGGGAQLLGAWLSQYLVHPWVGTLVLTGLAGLCWAGVAAAVRLISGRRAGGLGALVGVGVLALEQDYRQPLALAAALVVALLLLLLYLAARAHLSPAARIAGAGVMTAAALAGAGGLALGVLLCGAAVEARQRPRGLLVAAGVAVLGLGVVSALARYAYALPVSGVAQALLAPAGAGGRGPVGWLLCGTVAGVILAAVWQAGRAPGPAAPGVAGLGRGPLGPAAAGTAPPGLLPWPHVGGALAAAAALFVAWSGPDPGQRALLRLSWWSEKRQWDPALAQAAHLRTYTPEAVYQLQRALFHRGELLERLFAYPLLPGEGIFDASPDNLGRLVAVSDLLFDLGCLNGAEQLAHEALEVHGTRPSLLERLFLINMAKDRPAAADVFLQRLARGLVAGEWVAAVRRALEADRMLAGDPLVSRARALYPPQDYPGYAFLPEETLLQLLRHQPGNRMAFEYLLAHYLLTGQLDKVAVGVQRLDSFPEAYPRPAIPRHCEEALLILSAQRLGHYGRVPELVPPGRAIRPQTAAAFGRFSAALAAHPGDRAALRAVLDEDLWDTYWRFYALSAPAPGPAGGKLP